MYHNILLATDGSETANLALNEAMIFAKAGAQITAITVVDNPLTSYGLEYGGIAYDYEDTHQRFLDQAKQILKDVAHRAEYEHGIQLQTELIDLGAFSNNTSISQAIEMAANQHHSDLIVVGTHGRHGFKHFFLGSITEQLIRQSTHPVLIVRSPQNS